MNLFGRKKLKKVPSVVMTEYEQLCNFAMRGLLNQKGHTILEEIEQDSSKCIADVQNMLDRAQMEYSKHFSRTLSKL